MIDLLRSPQRCQQTVHARPGRPPTPTDTQRDKDSPDGTPRHETANGAAGVARDVLGVLDVAAVVDEPDRPCTTDLRESLPATPRSRRTVWSRTPLTPLPESNSRISTDKTIRAASRWSGPAAVERPESPSRRRAGSVCTTSCPRDHRERTEGVGSGHPSSRVLTRERPRAYRRAGGPARAVGPAVGYPKAATNGRGSSPA